MIVTVTPNPAVDITLTLDHLDPGHTHRVAPGIRRAGGKGLNVARVLTRMGSEALVVAPVGHDDLHWFGSDLGRIPSSLVEVPGNVRQSIAVVEPDRTTIINETGAAIDAEAWAELVAAVTDRLADATCLVASGSVPPGCPDTLYGDLVAAGRAAGIPVIADATGTQLRNAAVAGATVLKPNASELLDTTGESDPVAGARALQSMGAGLVLVSLGEAGMIAVPADRAEPVLAARLGRILTGNPTGAGDAGVAGVAALLALDPRAHLDTRAILARATAWSAAAVLEPIAGDVDPAQIADLEREITISAYEVQATTDTHERES